MKERLIHRRGLPAQVMRDMQVATFHAFLAARLREDPFGAGLDRGDAVLTESGRQLLLSQLRLRFGETFSEALLTGPEALGPDHAVALLEDFPRLLSKIRRYLLSPAAFYGKARRLLDAAGTPPDSLPRRILEWMQRFLLQYVQELSERHLIDFDDILIRGAELVQQRAQSEDPFQQRVFLIDEFQDNNPEQLGIVERFFADRDGHLTVVGDEKQSIYRFQGADVTAFARFPADQTIELDRNFRSYQEILDLAAGYLAATTTMGAPPQPAHLGPSPRPEPIACILVDQPKPCEADLVAGTIQSMVRRGLFLKKTERPAAYGDIAIIVKSIRYLDPSLEDALLARGIPYVMSGGLGFYDRSEITEVLSFLRLLGNPQDDHALVKILTGPLYGLTDRDLVELRLAGRSAEAPLLSHLLTQPMHALPQGARDFRTCFLHLKQLVGNVHLLDLVHLLLDEAGFLELAASQEHPLKRRRMENNLGKFVGMVRAFEQNGIFTTLRDFLTSMTRTLESGVDEDEAGLGLQEGQAVKILTVHKAKGLEFPIVFLPFTADQSYRRQGILHFTREEGLIFNPPNTREEHLSLAAQAYFARDRAAAQEENRRKMYVAMTRAEELLIISGEAHRAEKEAEPLAVISRLLDETPSLGKTVTPTEFSSMLEHWFAEGETAPPPEPAESPVALTGEDLLSEIQALTTFFHESAAATDTPAPTAEESFAIGDLKLFQECPRRSFFAAHHLPSFAEEKTSLETLAGNIVHRTLRISHEGSDWSAPGSERAEAVRRILAAILPLHGPEAEACRPRVEGILERYLDHPVSRDPAWLLEAEMNIRLEAPSGPFLLRGFADRVDDLPTGIRIIDYKTHAFCPDRHRAYETQMALYILAATRGILGHRHHLNFPEAHLLYLTGQECRLEAVEPDLPGFEHWAGSVVEAIRHSRFPPAVSGEFCSGCAFGPLCPQQRPESVQTGAIPVAFADC